MRRRCARTQRESTASVASSDRNDPVYSSSCEKYALSLSLSFAAKVRQTRRTGRWRKDVNSEDIRQSYREVCHVDHVVASSRVFLFLKNSRRVSSFLLLAKNDESFRT